jgi:hypothetical protein
MEWSRRAMGRHEEGCRYAHKCNFIYAHKKYMAFPALIFTKLTNVQQYYVQIPYNKLHPIRN